MQFLPTATFSFDPPRVPWCIRHQALDADAKRLVLAVAEFPDGSRVPKVHVRVYVDGTLFASWPLLDQTLDVAVYDDAVVCLAKGRRCDPVNFHNVRTGRIMRSIQDAYGMYGRSLAVIGKHVAVQYDNGSTQVSTRVYDAQTLYLVANNNRSRKSSRFATRYLSRIFSCGTHLFVPSECCGGDECFNSQCWDVASAANNYSFDSGFETTFYKQEIYAWRADTGWISRYGHAFLCHEVDNSLPTDDVLCRLAPGERFLCGTGRTAVVLGPGGTTITTYTQGDTPSTVKDASDWAHWETEDVCEPNSQYGGESDSDDEYKDGEHDYMVDKDVGRGMYRPCGGCFCALPLTDMWCFECGTPDPTLAACLQDKAAFRSVNLDG